MQTMKEASALSDAELEAKLPQLAADERKGMAALLVHLAVYDERKLYAGRYTSLFDYCRKALHYSESGAGKRIYACRALQDFPVIRPMLESGALHLEAVVLLKQHLTQENHLPVLKRARGRSKRDLERLVAELAPRPDVPDFIRKAPQKPVDPVPLEAPKLNLQAGPPRQRIEPLAPGRSSIRFTGSDELISKLDRACEILRHKFPSGKLEDVFLEILTSYLERKDPDLKKPAAPRESGSDPSRRIPQWVKDEVWRRDGGACVFETGADARCGSRNWLEYDHIVPWGLGGVSGKPSNIRLLCRTHNQLMGRRTFGEAAMRGRADA